MLSQILTCLLCIFNCHGDMPQCLPIQKEKNRREVERPLSQKNDVGSSRIQSNLSQSAIAIIQSPHIKTSVTAKKMNALNNQ